MSADEGGLRSLAQLICWTRNMHICFRQTASGKLMDRQKRHTVVPAVLSGNSITACICLNGNALEDSARCNNK
jgi:hypothetical protein